MIHKYKKYIPYILALILFLTPFMWFSNGGFDWGGDSSRLYFVDPISYLFNHTLYGVSPSGFGGQILSFYNLPIILSISLVRQFFGISETAALFLGIKLSFAFLFYCLTVKTILNENVNENSTLINIISIVSGLFYVFSPLLIEGWDKAIFTHDHIFLNPLMFYLLLKFLKSEIFLYLVIALFISVFFSHNFSFGAAPSMFSFYPVGFLFLFLYQIYIRKKNIPWKKLTIASLIFLGLHAFHLVPLLKHILDPGSDVYANIFESSGRIDRGQSYFEGISKNVKLSRGIFLLPQLKDSSNFLLFQVILPLTIIVTLIIKKNKLLLISIICFLLTLFFETANITSFGNQIYKNLFYYIPGFSMFRNYFGQWGSSFVFFYILTFSIALYYLTVNLSKKLVFAILGFLTLALTLNATPFINGDLINKEIWKSNGIRIIDSPTDDFLKSIEFVKKLPSDSKVLTLPLSDAGYQMIKGKNGNVYQGPSAIAYLAGKKDFVTTDSFTIYGDLLNKAVLKNDIELLKKILGFLNIKYIYYISDPEVYEKGFPKFPYEQSRLFFPKDQKGYRELLDKLDVKELAIFGGDYHIYELNNDNYLPNIYTANNIILTDSILDAFQIDTGFTIYIDSNPKKIQTQSILKAEEQYPFSSLKNNYQFHKHDPYVSVKPNSSLYPFVLIREDFEFSQHDDNASEMVDFSLLNLSKRLKEMELWGNQMSINKNNNYMNWNINLKRIKNGYLGLIERLNNFDISQNEKLFEKIKINQQLSGHTVRLISAIVKQNIKVQEKEILMNIVSNNNSEIESRLSIPLFEENKSSYRLNPIEGNVSVYIENIIPNESSIGVNDLSMPIYNADQKLKYTVIKNIKINANKEIALNFEEKNLLNDKDLFVNYIDKIQEYSLKNLKPSTQYVISFEYKTDNNGYFSYAYHDKKKNEKSFNEIFKNNLHSIDWKKEQTVFTTDGNYIDGKMVIDKSSGLDGQIDIKNIKVLPIISPVVLIHQDGKQNYQTPNVVFKKINPTKFDVRISNINGQFSLAFSDQFSKDWRLFTPQNSNAKISHFVANGYANGWFIEPSFTDNKKEMSLVLENTAQRYFYVGILISIVFIIGLLTYLFKEKIPYVK